MSLTEELVCMKVEEAASGNAESARWCIQEFCNSIKADVNPDYLSNMDSYSALSDLKVDPQILIYLHACFELLLEDDELDAALVLGLKQGLSTNPDNDLNVQDIGFCQSIMVKVAQEVPIEKALMLTAKEFHVSQSILKAIWRNANNRLTTEMMAEFEKRLEIR